MLALGADTAVCAVVRQDRPSPDGHSGVQVTTAASLFAFTPVAPIRCSSGEREIAAVGDHHIQSVVVK
jgi:hypothetical protein